MSKRDEILETITNHLGGRGLDVDKIKPEAELGSDVGLDSLDTVELTLALEKHYSIEIPDGEAADLVTVSDALDLIESKLTVQA